MDRREDGCVNVLYVDPFSGISGDMLMGALIDLGAPTQELVSTVKAISQDADLEIRDEERCTIRGNRVIVHLPKGEECKERGFKDFLLILEGCLTLDPWVKERAIQVLRILFEAEARVHGQEVERLHLHELGSLDTLIDIVGALVLVRTLGIEKIYSGPLPISRGWIETAHGKMPCPAPAVAVMAEGLPVYGVETPYELVTPTGIALLRSLAQGFGEFPEMVVRRVGHGVGAREVGVYPNLLRLWLGRDRRQTHAQVMEITTVIDDMPGEILSFVQGVLLKEGALDCYIIPVIMKKGRPGVELHVISPVGHEARLMEIVLRETTTIGVRVRPAERVCVPRERTHIETPWGRIDAKRVEIFGRERTYPEYESARRLAEEGSIPLIEIYRSVK